MNAIANASPRPVPQLRCQPARLLCRVLLWLLLVSAWAMPIGKAGATLFFTDHFNYTDGADLGSTNGGGGGIWNFSHGEVSQIKVTAASAQTAPPGFAAASGLGVAVTPGDHRKALGVLFNGATGVPAVAGNTVYASFLLDVQKLPANGNLRVAYLHFAQALQAGIEMVVSSTGQVGVQKKGGGTTYVSGTPVASPGTHLVVMRYSFQGSDDPVAVWVDPDRSSYGVNPAPTTGAFASTTTGGSDLSSAVTCFFIDSPAEAGPVFWIDEVRVGTTWADVTPRGGPPLYSFLVLPLAFGLVAAGLWIRRLRHKVEERSAALKAQIQERQNAEHQRLRHQERARIAHDLHDELGADITEIGMLATRAQDEGGDPADRRRCLDQLAVKTRQMVAKLEEIVWAMDPRHDSLGALVSYFTFYADRFLGLANIRLLIDNSESAAGTTVEARARYQLFLVFKEALANVVRHSGADQVRLVVHFEPPILRVSVADNGGGLPEPPPGARGQDGIANMRARIEKLGGQFEITGEPGRGTTVNFSVPLQS